MIIFLNGPSSSGKTLLAKSIQKKWPKPILHFGTFVLMSLIDGSFIDKKNKRSILGFYFQQMKINNIYLQKFCIGLYGRRIWNATFGCIKALIDNHNDLIIEEVVTDKKLLNKYLSVLKNQKVYFVGIKCPIKVIENREKTRGDRIVGQSRSVYELVHPKNRSYDIYLDTSKNSPDKCAGKLISYIKQNPNPHAWKKL